MAVLTKNNRIDIRLSDEDKRLIEKAASCFSQSISSYILTVVIKQAKLDLMDYGAIVLSNQDRDYVLNKTDEPGEPNDNLKNLFK